ncbi:DUF5681 domain-containing protein [Agriterribacter sp.]|uniref:DUF5681 domain-containing protein n=1 Tax=Agriterribacter sp. TaxID=2821509 RepID=UPI002CD6445D|nr:DUF5681 domain-containing protein [Agriterribacter sp.]HRO47687.1 DUF5681 domain-containing protein [Agriterribacter sp.]HRQ17668.1 DUF5681 domain-containing protein [Agriterribacter sp.]
MAQRKGQTGNPNGRPKGSPNKATKDLRRWVTTFIESQTDQIQQDWQQLEPKDRIVLFEKLLKYSLPTLQATSLTTDLEKLSDEDLDRIVNEILNRQQ